MSDLKPWLEEGAPEAIAQLLKAARRETPPAQTLPRVLAAVGAGVATVSTTAVTGATLGQSGVSGAAVAKASLVSGASVMKWMLVGAALGGAVVTVGELQRQSERVAPPSATPLRTSATTSSLPQASPEPQRRVPPQIVPAPSAKSVTSLAGRTTSERDTQVEVRPAAPAAVDSERLAEEVRAIDEANSALANGRPEQTLSALDRYDLLHRQPRFAPEALYLRMEALMQLSRRAEANQVAEQLVANYPKSPQAVRARLLLSQTIP